ncbi:MAG: VTC domain-containing protein, partial [Clostridiales bacterium]|nr:VTC domain-containing protein [Clostridiales bacterium]
RYQHLRPRSIVDYRREAYAFRAGNVRVTFDSNIRTSNSVSGFLQPGLCTIPAAGAILMEIKYDGFLPDLIRDVVQIACRSQTEFSKYVAARLV